jgi:hypothetical protein
MRWLSLTLASCAVPVDDFESATAVPMGTDETAARHTRDEAGFVIAGKGSVGQSVAVLDADADGIADLLVGAPMASGPGEAYLVFGPESGRIRTASARTIRSDLNAYLGTAVVGGDVDLDGIDDLLVGGPAYRSNSAYLFHGPVTSDRDVAEADARFLGFRTDSRCDFTGADVDLPGDVDGDALPDVVVGAPLARAADGKVFVASGPVSGTVRLARDATYTFLGESGSASGAHLGFGTTSIGDVNGDGIGDLAMGAEGARSGGAVYVVNGGLAPGFYEVERVATAIMAGFSNFGFRVTAADLDNDGTTDLVVGAPWSDSAFGFVGPFSGEVSITDASVVWNAPTAVEWFGAGLATGDANADGRVDVLLSARNAAYLQLGPASGVVDVATLHSFPAESPTPYVGGDMAAFVPDWDGDGGDEIALGDPRAEEDVEGGLVGHVYVFFSGSLF